MATGYTADIQSGKLTELRPFAMQCARAFGALITMRDDPFDAPVPLRFEPRTDYHDESIADANDALARLAAMTPQECKAAATAANQRSMMEWTKRAKERALFRQRYDDMIAKVQAWRPQESVSELKNFMLEQLRSSADDDCSGKYDKRPEPQTGADWHAGQIEYARRQLAYATRNRADEIARTDERNLWLDALRVSLVDNA